MQYQKTISATLALFHVCQLSAMLARKPVPAIRVPKIQKTYVQQRQFIPEVIGAVIGTYMGWKILNDQVEIGILTERLNKAHCALIKALGQSMDGNAQGNINALLAYAPQVTLEAKIDDASGNTILHHAAIAAMWDTDIPREKFDHLCAFIRACVASGASLGIKNKPGFTAPHLAIVGALAGIDKKTPGQIAQQRRCLEAFGLLNPDPAVLAITDGDRVSIAVLLDVYHITIANIPGINPV